jgi:hypothetical protein
MNINVLQITQQIELLNHKHLDELNLFIEFLITKQKKEVKKKPFKKPLLADIQALPIPVSEFIIHRDEIYESRI